MAFEAVGSVVMDLDKLLYVEPGIWDTTKQDHRAVFVFLGGTRFESTLGMREAEARLVTHVMQLGARGVPVLP